jgi:hypothetical protein
LKNKESGKLRKIIARYGSVDRLNFEDKKNLSILIFKDSKEVEFMMLGGSAFQSGITLFAKKFSLGAQFLTVGRLMYDGENNKKFSGMTLNFFEKFDLFYDILPCKKVKRQKIIQIFF